MRHDTQSTGIRLVIGPGDDILLCQISRRLRCRNIPVPDNVARWFVGHGMDSILELGFDQAIAAMTTSDLGSREELMAPLRAVLAVLAFIAGEGQDAIPDAMVTLPCLVHAEGLLTTTAVVVSAAGDSAPGVCASCARCGGDPK